MSVQLHLKIHLPIRLLSQLTCMASLDRGCSSTKLVLAETNDDSPETFSVTFALARNSEFDASLQWLAERMPIGPDGIRTIALTGGGSALYKDKICSTLRAEPVFVDELVGQARGSVWLIQQAPAEEVFYADSFLTPLTEKVDLPALYVFSGSGNGLSLLYPDGSKCQDHIMMHGGKAFLGHGALLLGTSDYDEIARLAEKGDPASVLAADERGEFDLEPEELGRLSREDVALRLCSWFVRWSAYFVHHGIRTSGLANVFLGCNFWRARVLRRLFASSLRRRLAGTEFESALKIRAFRMGHNGAIGSMVTRPGEEISFIRDDGFCRME